MPGPAGPGPQLEKLLGRLGVGSKDTIVIYSDQCDHAHLWWLLAYYGFPLDRLKLLDGGFEAWKGKGYPTQLTSPRLQARHFQVSRQPRQGLLLATLEQVKAAMGPPRRASSWTSAPRSSTWGKRPEGAARRGHIPGAVGDLLAGTPGFRKALTKGAGKAPRKSGALRRPGRHPG